MAEGIFSYAISQWARSFPCGSAGKESACNAGDPRSVPGLRRSPGEGNGYPLQYSGLENVQDSMAHGVAKSWTQLRDFHFTSLHFPVDWGEKFWKQDGSQPQGMLGRCSISSPRGVCLGPHRLWHPTPTHTLRPFSCLDSLKWTMRLWNCGAGEDSWESLGLQGDQTSQS